MSKIYPQIQRTEASYHIYISQQPVRSKRLCLEFAGNWYLV